MNIHGYPCISMDIHGHSWICMHNHGYPWISMDIHGCKNLLLVMLKNNQKRAAECGLGEARFWFLFTHVYTLYKKIKKAKLKKTWVSDDFWKKSLWNHFKKSETFTNRSGLKNQYQRWVSCTLFVWRMTISLKNIEISTRFSMFEGADFRNFRKSGFPKVWTHHYIRFFMEI